MFSGTWSQIALTVAVFGVGLAAGVAGASFAQREFASRTAVAASSEPSTRCVSNAETLHIAADEAVVPIVEELADQYTDDLLEAGRECIPIEVRSVASAAVVGRLANGWRSNTHGPRPDVWIPKSTLWVDLLRAQLDDPSILSEEPTVLARSPTVMALPRPMAKQLGWPDRRLGWGDFFQLADSEDGWAAADKPEWGPFRLDMTDPRYTTTGLQAMRALDVAQRAEGGPKTGSPASLTGVQRVLDSVDARSTDTLERYARAKRPMREMSAVPLEEREVWRFNTTQAASASMPEPTEQPSAATSSAPVLVAMYPKDSGGVAMEANYPYVLLDASWVGRDVLMFSDEFGDYLLSDTGAAMFADAGFRTRNNQPGDALRAGEGLQALNQVGTSEPGDGPKIDPFRKLRSSWVDVRRPGRTLLLVDVSGSMATTVPETGRTRLQEAVDAATGSLQALPDRSEVGLWEFSTSLSGGDSGGDYRRLVPIGPLTDEVDGRPREAALIDELAGLTPANDTALNDTLLAAYRDLRSSYAMGSHHVIVLITDGTNDDADSVSHSELLRSLTQLHRAQEPIQIVAVAYGDEPDLDSLTEITERVGGRVIASPELTNLEELLSEALGR